ncbi:LysE family translocator [Pseudomonas sp. LP_7_YM]|uniref:LysE family translocator n=1 Tax=Pseudomonas sp. LP_7_YM TaxID=2485137 RepID=UPI00105B4926|nr:LysE family translocator [Pseudomonas sp. LP_7_YM]TDV67763.1 threonine/homoserine/homoserine lactone efflux protein [Pseudomonas sp. LP_7_YM]
MNLALSMAAFALAASISPGPVNVVALSCGAQFGLLASQRHVMGATVGFVVLLIFTGFGLHEVLHSYPIVTDIIRWAGMAFLVYLACRLAMDDGRLNIEKSAQRPSFWRGAAMQWLNPKAWLAAVAGMGAFLAGGEAELIGLFALIYFVVCYLSVGCWVYAGAFLGPWLRSPQRIRTFNRSMAALLTGCAVSLLYV